jgi:hypothetical protein
MENKTFHITKYNFLQWYFEDGQDSENAQIKQDLAESIIQVLVALNTAVVTTNDIIKHCNQGGIAISYLEEFKDSDIHTELADYEPNYELILID